MASLDFSTNYLFFVQGAVTDLRDILDNKTFHFTFDNSSELYIDYYANIDSVLYTPSAGVRGNAVDLTSSTDYALIGTVRVLLGVCACVYVCVCTSV